MSEFVQFDFDSKITDSILRAFSFVKRSRIQFWLCKMSLRPYDFIMRYFKKYRDILKEDITLFLNKFHAKGRLSM